MKKIGLVMFVLLAMVFVFVSLSYGGSHHYLVFQQDGQQIKLLHHKLVRVVGLVSKTDAEISALAERSDSPHFVAHVLGANGEILHQDFIAAQKEIRGEFYNASGQIEGEVLNVDKPVFVVRVPAVGNKLRLSRTSQRKTGMALDLAEPQITFEMDLSGLAQQPAAMDLSPAPAPDTMVLGGDGNSGNRVDILIMGDGYTQAERVKFFSDAQNLYTNFFNITPYKEYKNFVKVTALHTPSNQSGADHPPYNPNCNKYDYSCCADPAAQYDSKAAGAGTYVDTAFNSTFCGSPYIQRLLIPDAGKVLASAAVMPDWDSIMVIVNDDTYGGSGGYISTFSTSQSVVPVAQHEYGHSFAGLADEYDYGYPSGYYICDDTKGQCPANITNQTVRESIKWNPWILPSTPIPTYAGGVNLGDHLNLYDVVAGLFEGAMYTEHNLYRSAYNCAMRSLWPSFCAICTQEYILRLYRGGWGIPKGGIDLIEPSSEIPAASDVMVAAGTGLVNFSVGLLQPIGGPVLEILWLVNGVQVASGVSYFSYTPGNQSVKIEVKVRDLTSLVNPAMAGDALTSSRIWNVLVIDPCTFSLSAANNSLGPGASSASVSVSTKSGCAWTASTNSGSWDWIGISSGWNGVGNGTVNYLVLSNRGNTRTGTLAIAGQTFTITQQGGCTYSISPANNTFNKAGGSASVSVTTSNGCSWTASTNSGSWDWIGISSGWNGTGNGTANYFLLPNNSGRTRTGTLAIAGQTFTITQQ